jgi:hypothetical protein
MPKLKGMANIKFLGIFLNPFYVQSEGLQCVFDNLESVGAQAICVPLRLARPASQAQGVRFPPLHVDGYERVLARPLWGKYELYVELFPAYEPDISLYAGGPYAPITKPVPSDIDRAIADRIIAEARKRGIQVHVMIQPFVPPGIRAEDQPAYIDGARPQPPQVTLNACLSSPAARTYALALVKDTLQHYRDVDGLFMDWAEYGAYRLEDHFTCFCTHCELEARDQGLDWEAIRQDVMALWSWFHSLTSEKLEHARRLLGNPSALLELLTHFPGWLNLLQLKAKRVVGFYQQVKQLMDSMGLGDMALSARGWPPPWNRSSGMDYRSLSEICSAVTPKLFTFDYSALPRWYGQTLLTWNPNLPEAEMLDALVEWLNLQDRIEQRSLAHYHIPSPGESHPAKMEVYRNRLDEIVDQVDGRAHCYPFAHAYLPDGQWERMIATIRASRVDGMWVQMYGYLSQAKLEILREMWI